jgi:hypothetical protein
MPIIVTHFNIKGYSMNIKLVFLTLSLFIVFAVKAQSKGFAGFFNVSYENVSNVKSQLQSMMPAMRVLRNNFYGIGGEGYWKSGKVIFGANGNVLSHGVVNNGGNHRELFTGTAVLKTGYVVYENSNLFIYPSIALGTRAILISSYVTSDDVKSQFHSIYLLSPAIDFGLNADQIVYRFVNRPLSGVFIAGLRTGYRLSLRSDHWRRINDPLMIPTNFSNNAFYITVAVGIGYFNHLSSH